MIMKTKLLTTLLMASLLALDNQPVVRFGRTAN